MQIKKLYVIEWVQQTVVHSADSWTNLLDFKSFEWKSTSDM
jgi:hypothetical protein